MRWTSWMPESQLPQFISRPSSSSRDRMPHSYSSYTMASRKPHSFTSIPIRSMTMPKARPPAVSSKLPMRALVALIPSYSGSSPTIPLYLPSVISKE